jgi:Ser/Thr protein kinase RdoA (MazF antagonist)
MIATLACMTRDPHPLTIDGLSAALAPWGLPVRSVERLTGGWNSSTWLVRVASGGGNSGDADELGDADDPYIAKLGDTEDADAFCSGLRVATLAAAHGFSSGPPVPTLDGRLAVDLPEGVLALLSHVPGTPPDESSTGDLRRVGSTLARAHLALGNNVTGLSEQFIWPWSWAPVCIDEIPMPKDIRDTAARVLDQAGELAGRAPLRMGVVHADPGLDAFLLSEESARLDGLIDWSVTMQAPVLHDLACFAVMTRRNPRLLERCVAGYLDTTPELAGELEHLGTFVRLRWMCQAMYFASRISRGIVRGAASEEENHQGLAEAHRGMTAADGVMV